MGFFSNPLKLHKKILKSDPLTKKLTGGGSKSGSSTASPKQTMSRLAGRDDAEARKPLNGRPGRPGVGNTGVVPPHMRTGGPLPATKKPSMRTGGNLPPQVAKRPARQGGTTFRGGPRGPKIK